METVNIRAFGKTYPLPRSLLDRSGLLQRIFGAQASGINEITLTADPRLQPAFEYLYHKLLERSGPNFLKFLGLGQISDVLLLQSFIPDLVMLIDGGHIPPDILRANYGLYQSIPALREAADRYLASQSSPPPTGVK